MNEQERDDKIQDLLIEFHMTRSVTAACEACDLLFEALTEGELDGE